MSRARRAVAAQVLSFLVVPHMPWTDPDAGARSLEQVVEEGVDPRRLSWEGGVPEGFFLASSGALATR